MAAARLGGYRNRLTVRQACYSDTAMTFIVRSLILLSLPLAMLASRWTVDDIVTMEKAEAMELSRDGRRAVWVESATDDKKGATVSNLFLRHLDEDWKIQLTRTKDRNTKPRFSPDARRIAFLSNRPKTDGDEKGANKPVDQVWLLDLRGGEPRRLTEFVKGAKDVHWLDDNALLITATEDPSAYEQHHKKRKDTSRVVDDDDHEPPVRLFRYDIKAKKTTRLTDNNDRIIRTAVSASGAWAVTVRERSLRYTYDQKVKPATYLHDLKRGTAARILAELVRSLGKPVFSGLGPFGSSRPCEVAGVGELW